MFCKSRQLQHNEHDLLSNVLGVLITTCPLLVITAILLHAQVMDPKTATNERVIRDHKPDHTLISFFGDDSYGWFPKGRDIVSFASNYIGKSKQAAAKKVSTAACCRLLCCWCYHTMSCTSCQTCIITPCCPWHCFARCGHGITALSSFRLFEETNLHTHSCQYLNL